MSSTTWPPLSLTSTTRVTLQLNTRMPFLSTTRESVLLQRKLAKGSEATSQARKWKCTSECKLPTSEERKRIVSLKLQFDKSSIPALRWASDKVDTGCPHLHASTPFTCKHKGKREYNSDQCRELKGHPLPCSAQVDSECLSTLRLLRAVAPHYTRICRSFFTFCMESIDCMFLLTALTWLCTMGSLRCSAIS